MTPEHDISAPLERLRAAFDTDPTLLSDRPVHVAGPAGLPQHLPELADALAAVSNDGEGVFGLAPRPPRRARRGRRRLAARA